MKTCGRQEPCVLTGQVDEDMLMIESILVGCENEGFRQMVTDIARSYGILLLETCETTDSMETSWHLDKRAEGILFFTEDPDTDTVNALRTLAGNCQKPWLCLPPDEDAVHTLAARTRDWIHGKGIGSMQLACDIGFSRLSVCGDILKACFAMCLLRTRPDRLQDALKSRPLLQEDSPYPDVASVLADLDLRLPLRDKVTLAHLDGEFPSVADSALAVYILGHYLWPPNEALLADCARRGGLAVEEMEEQVAVEILLDALLDHLRKTCRLRLVSS